jgi:UDP-glucuronate decarboxylase
MVFRPLPADDPMQRRPDITLANKKLGWKPAIKLNEGLKRTIEYFAMLLSDELKTKARAKRRVAKRPARGRRSK